MPDRKTEIIRRLDDSRAYLHSVIADLTAEQWDTPVQQTDARWTARQMLGHLREAERGMTGQITRIAAGQESVPTDFDLNRWNKRQVEKLADKPAAEIAHELDDVRTNLKTVIAELSEADLDKRGRHGSLAIMSIEEILLLIADHETAHAQEIAAIKTPVT